MRARSSRLPSQSPGVSQLVVNDPLRVLVIAPTPFFGDRGCHVRIYEEARGLARIGIETRVVTYPTGGDVPDVAVTRARALSGVRARALGPSAGRPLLDLGVLGAARRVAREFRPHLLHGHLHEGIAIGVALRVGAHRPLIADLQGSLTAELADHGVVSEDGVPARVIRRVEGWLVRRPDRIVTSSHHEVAPLVAQGVDPERIEPLPDGVDLEAFRPGPPDPELRRRLGVDGKRVIGFLGVLTAYQGVDVLLEAAPLVARAHPDAHFLVMGYPNEARYRDIVRARGLDALVTLTGRVPYAEAARWLGLAEVAVSPKRSLTEANGKLLNYMACALPVVASDTPINRELLGEHGRYAAVDDPGSLATRIVELLDDPTRARALGDGLRRRAADRFAWPALIERLAAIYRTMV